MTCRDCDCDRCLEAHPWTDERIAQDQAEHDHQALAAIYEQVYGQQLEIQHYFDARLILGHLAIASMMANNLNRNIQVGLNIVSDLLAGEGS